MTFRVLVCGGRDYADTAAVFDALDRVHKTRGISVIIDGAQTGADRMASDWAKSRCVPLLEFPADWKRFGGSAGPIRNRQMLNEGQPTAVIAFPGGRGTAHMIRTARAVGLPVWQPHSSG